ncbi:MAG: hypothetical protein KGJ23_06055 [Euryarchaeota archaeon]|nr:hypothetical protein [Euryarchaeota archaeon]MDE1836162.1 hypothetical protein [Euryarchaeota archaeon]MDE1881017.1 hypothetical protein [Euryarchaeota archaeon]MDE2045475.1 hypothetical protein [Thermoplasmata archaeon]
MTGLGAEVPSLSPAGRAIATSPGATASVAATVPTTVSVAPAATATILSSRGAITTSFPEPTATSAAPVLPASSLASPAVLTAVPVPGATIVVALGRGSVVLSHLDLERGAHPRGPI